MATAYQLTTYIYSFNGTDHESLRDLRILAMSKNKQTLEEIKDKIEGTSNGYFGRCEGDESPYIAASHKHYELLPWQERIKIKNPTFEMTLDSGRVIQLFLYPVSNYYGSGAMESLHIEQIQYIDLDEFI